MLYQGIDLTPPKGTVSLTHSIALDAIRRESSTKNMDWFQVLGNFPWSLLKNEYLQGYDNVCRLYSLAQMDYQICNGGIAQYFGNRYHEGQAPHHGDDVALYDISEQKKDFARLVAFAQEVYPARVKENAALATASNAFEKLWLEEDAEGYETIYCEEDAYITDTETGEEIENPDYFEPYDETTYEDIIHGYDGFDKTFFNASAYFEELLELCAQFYCKLFARDIEKHAVSHPELTQKMREILPPDAFDTKPVSTEQKPSLSSRIQNANTRAHSADATLPAAAKDLTHERS